MEVRETARGWSLGEPRSRLILVAAGGFGCLLLAGGTALWSGWNEARQELRQERNLRLLEGIRRGWIHLDGMYANLLTGIASSEGLMRSLEAAERLSELSPDLTGMQATTTS